MRNKWLLVKSPRLWYFCYSSLNRLIQYVIDEFLSRVSPRTSLLSRSFYPFLSETGQRAKIPVSHRCVHTQGRRPQHVCLIRLITCSVTMTLNWQGQFSATPPPSCATLEKVVNFSEFPNPPLQNKQYYLFYPHYRIGSRIN